jgi:hypothetical protein
VVCFFPLVAACSCAFLLYTLLPVSNACAALTSGSFGGTTRRGVVLGACVCT